MKRTSLQIFLLSVFLVHVSNLSGQEANSFSYPLNLGDFWEYLWFPGFEETLEVVGDTLMPNGHHYRVLEHELWGHLSISYQRISDENELFQIDQFETEEYLWFKLDTELADSWKVPEKGGDSLTYVVIEMGDTTLWSHEFKYTKIIAPEAFLLEFILVDSIGIFHKGFEGGHSELKGAIINGKGFGVLTNAKDEEPVLPKRLVLNENYPNPFDPTTTIAYSLASRSKVVLTIYNLLGQEVKALVNEVQTPGNRLITWDGRDNQGDMVGSGVYIYSIRTGTRIEARKMVRLP